MGDESARHPFLQSLPPHVRGGKAFVCRGETEVAVAVVEHRLAERYGHALRHSLAKGLARGWGKVKASPKAVTAADVRAFLLAYCACFVAVSAFVY